MPISAQMSGLSMSFTSSTWPTCLCRPGVVVVFRGLPARPRERKSECGTVADLPEVAVAPAAPAAAAAPPAQGRLGCPAAERRRGHQAPRRCRPHGTEHGRQPQRADRYQCPRGARKLLIDKPDCDQQPSAARPRREDLLHPLIGYAVVQALKALPEMNAAYAEEDGKPFLATPHT